MYAYASREPVSSSDRGGRNALGIPAARCINDTGTSHQRRREGGWMQNLSSALLSSLSPDLPEGKEYIGRRNRSSGTRTSILGPLGPVGPLAPGGRENRPNSNHATWHQSYSTYLAQFWWLLVTVPDLIGCILADFGYLGIWEGWEWLVRFLRMSPWITKL